jgi:hypothetical protein
VVASWRDKRWASKAAAPPISVRTAAEIDPQHMTPDPNRYPVDWIASELAPTLPLELMGDQLLQLPTHGGPVDREPVSHEYGVGAGPGLTDAQNRAVMEPWHQADLGSAEARRYQSQAARDGAYHVEVVPDMIGDGNSPETVTLREVTGVGAANDPFARRAQRIWRWRDRWIDRHMYGVEQRPVYLRNAFTATAVPPGPASAYTSPYPTAPATWGGRAGIGTPDQLVMPQERRIPRPWDEAYTTDPTAAAGGTGYGLTSWGL